MKFVVRFVPIFALLILVGTSPADTPTESSVEIVYQLGHAVHRFTAQAGARQVTATSLRDHRILVAERVVDRQLYLQFVSQVETFIAGLPSDPLKVTCRGPFSVSLKKAGSVRSAQGCRSLDEGTLSRLVKDAEFLLYSKS